MTTEWKDERVDGYLARLNAVSEDIKSLEAYLAASGVQVPTAVYWENGDEWIAWGHAEPERWRIICGSGKERRPFIEMKSDVRLRLAPLLPKLLTALGDAVAALGKPAAQESEIGLPAYLRRPE